MQFIDDKICLVNVNVAYLHELHKVSSEVPFAEGYQNKPFVGILILNNDINYVIPLSSAKEKHKKWKNEGQDYFIIYEVSNKQAMSAADIYTELDDCETSDKVKHLLSVLDLKKMIPVTDDVCNAVDVNIAESDIKDVKKYKKLLEKELQCCIELKNKILQKAEKLYTKQIQRRNVRFCVDFAAVEEVCKNYTVNA
ncbi:MAG: type III toxin-antitoxin system ToxN/AbiQ family toxin [Selenomonas sp.]|nr:type III toxin-antitoxin system ToxN/AbiQ family toxin [Selenomonas sp.]